MSATETQPNAPVVLLHRVEGPVNLGAVCRAMANTGVDQLRFTGPLTQDHPEALKFAVHAGPILEDATKAEDLSQLIANLDLVFGFTPRAPWDDGRNVTLDQCLELAREAKAKGQSIGLLFGNEAHGLQNDELAVCHYRVALPTSAQYVSMNLAQAVLVVLWELHRDGSQVQTAQAPPNLATAAEKEILLRKVRDFLDAMDFLDPQNPEHLWMEIQPLFKTRDWTDRELNLLRGIFAKGAARYKALAKKTDQSEP